MEEMIYPDAPSPGLRIAIATGAVRTSIPSYVTEVGATPIRVEDGAPFPKDVDVLLIYRSARDFRRFEHMLANWSGARPKIFLWHQEPLLPEELTKEAEEAGLGIAARSRSPGLLGRIIGFVSARSYRRIAREG